MEDITKPISFKYEQFEVYSAEDVYTYDPVFFNGIKLTSFKKSIIDKFNLIENTDYIKLIQKKSIWNLVTTAAPKAKLFLTKQWVDTHVPKFKDDISNDDYECPPAPGILELNDNEKFKDTDGNVLDIEVRGTRNKKDTYFKLKDVSKEFDINRLYDSLIEKTGNYEENIHYKYFSIYNKTKSLGKITNRKELFLTYKGMLKVLFASRSGNAENFTDWVEDIVHTVHIGTKDTKNKLASSLLGVDVKTIKKVLSTKSGKIPCIYLFFVGFAKDIIKDNTINHDGNEIICKFGITDDLKRRSEEHAKTYKLLYDSKIELLTFSIIDPVNEHEAEVAIKSCFRDNLIKLDTQTELIKIKKDRIKDIKKQYVLIQNSYIGAQKGLESTIEELRAIIKEKEYQFMLIEKDNNYIKFTCEAEKKEIKAYYEIIIEKYENKLKDKDIELLNYKIKYLESIK